MKIQRLYFQNSHKKKNAVKSCEMCLLGLESQSASNQTHALFPEHSMKCGE